MLVEIPITPPSVTEAAELLIQRISDHPKLKSATFFTGARACFKSSQVKIIGLCASERSVCAIDTSMAINHHRSRGTPIGRMLDCYDETMKMGRYVPGALVFIATGTYLFDWQEMNECSPWHLALAGAPRSDEEEDLWRRAIPSGRIVHLRNTFEDVVTWTVKRHQNGEQRDDHELEALENNWQSYQTITVPMVDRVHTLGKSAGQHLTREIESREHAYLRTQKIIHFMDAPENVKNDWLEKLDVRDHPARQLIEKLEEVPIRKVAPARAAIARMNATNGNSCSGEKIPIQRLPSDHIPFRLSAN